jgi:hypothetical protein
MSPSAGFGHWFARASVGQAVQLRGALRAEITHQRGVLGQWGPLGAVRGKASPGAGAYMSGVLAHRIDEWRRQQRYLPNASEAVRRLIEIVLDSGKPKPMRT